MDLQFYFALHWLCMWLATKCQEVSVATCWHSQDDVRSPIGGLFCADIHQGPHIIIAILTKFSYIVDFLVLVANL